MKRVAILLTAAAVSGMSIVQVRAADKANSPTTAPSSLSATNKAANNGYISDNSADSHIRNLMGNMANHVVASKDMSALVSQFDQAAQQRMSKSSAYSQGFGTKLGAQIDDLSRSWKQKYGHDFSIKNASDTLGSGFVKIREGIPSNSQLVGQVSQAAAEKSSGNSYSAEQAIALAHVQAGANLSDLQVPLVCQKDGAWKIEVPNSLTAEKLCQNLTMQLTAMNQHKSQWPASETDAYREVSRHILLAVMDKPGSASGQVGAKSVSLNATQAPTAAKPQAIIKSASASSAATHHWWQFWNW